MGDIIQLGHTITFDWTKNVEEVGPDPAIVQSEKDEAFLKKCAQDDEYGVKRAQLLVAIGHPKVCGTLVEIGMALRQGIPVALIGEFPSSVFWRLPQIKRFGDEEAFLKIGLLPAEGTMPVWSEED